MKPTQETAIANTPSLEMMKRARAFADWIYANFGGEFKATDRSRAAAGCFAVVQDHFSAITYLIETGHPSPACSLSRTAYEGYVRGAWLLHCASDAHVQDFLDEKTLYKPLKPAVNPRRRGKLKPQPYTIGNMIEDLEQKRTLDQGALATVKSAIWHVLCDYAHVGGRLVKHWNSSDAIECNFDQGTLDVLLHVTGMMAGLAAVGFCELSSPPNDAHAELVLEQFRIFAEDVQPFTSAGD